MLMPLTKEACAAEKNVTVDQEVREVVETDSGELKRRPRCPGRLRFATLVGT